MRSLYSIEARMPGNRAWLFLGATVSMREARQWEVAPWLYKRIRKWRLA
jgi:hypothetical protein